MAERPPLDKSERANESEIGPCLSFTPEQIYAGFLTTIMWDGREPSLTSQAIDATLIHAQAAAPPSVPQQQQMVAFELGIFTAQIHDDNARSLKARGATGGPDTLEDLLVKQPLDVELQDPVIFPAPLTRDAHGVRSGDEGSVMKTERVRGRGGRGGLALRN